ncbi:MAG: YkgJ family cysteine cluster protein [Fibrobacterales bacterium]
MIPFPELRDLPKLAKQSAKSTKVLIKNFRSRRPPNLDEVTHEYHEKAFEQIDCLDCGNCCSKLPALVKFKDIRPIAIALDMGDGDFMAEYIRNDRDDGEMIFNGLPCPFLEKEGCNCTIYDNRPKSCQAYPHTDTSRIMKQLGFIQRDADVCPAVWWIVENLKVHYKERYK